MTPEQMVNTARYPIDAPDAQAATAFAAKCHATYEQTGLCMLPDFVVGSACQQLAAEAAAVDQHAWFCNSSHNVYLTQSNAESAHAPEAAQRQQNTFVGSVPYDRIGQDSLLNTLYQWDPLMQFIARVLGKTRLHRFADPLGACSINVFVDGGEHGWHFDESEFTITLMLQAPESGGAFEYVPKIRGLEDEHSIVRDILNDQYDGVVELPFTAGTLLIFGGRQTIHRVTRVSGKVPRLVPVLCYSEQPGQSNSDGVRQLFWGRTG